MLYKILEWVWSLFPDHCEMPDCSKRGVRGNENLVDGKVICDYCYTRLYINDKTLHEELVTQLRDHKRRSSEHPRDL